MTTAAPRFAGLQKALAKISARTADEKQRLRAAANGETFTGRLKSTKVAKPVAAAPKPSAVVVTASKKPAVSTAQPSAIAIPADVSAQGPKAVAAYEVGYARAKARGAELSKHPAVAARSAEAMQLFSQGKSNAEIISALTADQKAEAADAVWAKARASIDGQRSSTSSDTVEPTSQPAPSRRLTAAEMKADAVWDRARASIDGDRPAAATDRKPAAGAKSGSADDIWARAYAAAAR